jgi:hypothetical protein
MDAPPRYITLAPDPATMIPGGTASPRGVNLLSLFSLAFGWGGELARAMQTQKKASAPSPNASPNLSSPTSAPAANDSTTIYLNPPKYDLFGNPLSSAPIAVARGPGLVEDKAKRCSSEANQGITPLFQCCQKYQAAGLYPGDACLAASNVFVGQPSETKDYVLPDSGLQDVASLISQGGYSIQSFLGGSGSGIKLRFGSLTTQPVSTTKKTPTLRLGTLSKVVPATTPTVAGARVVGVRTITLAPGQKLDLSKLGLGVYKV